MKMIRIDKVSIGTKCRSFIVSGEHKHVVSSMRGKRLHTDHLLWGRNSRHYNMTLLWLKVE